MSSVRLRYSGVLNFLATMARLLVSLGFIVVVTRRLSVEEFGLWVIISSLVNYPLMPVGLWGYWCSRYVARRVPRSFGTGVAVTLLYLPLAVLVYALAAYAMHAYVVEWGLRTMLLLGTLLLVMNLVGSIISGVSSTLAPEVSGYGSLVFQALRLPIALILVVVLGLSLDGALLTVIICQVASLSVTIHFLRRRGLRWDGVDFGLVKRWFKGLSIPLIGIISGLLSSSDSVLLAALCGSEVPVAYMGASYNLRNPVTYGQATVSGLYAKMLREGTARDVEEISRLYFAVTTFMLITILCLSYPLMSLLNPIYRDAYWIVLITGVFTFIQGVVGIFGSVVSGREEVDLKPSVTIKDFIVSKLFKWSSTALFMYIISLAIGSALLIAFIPLNNVILLASAYPIGWLIGWLAFLPRFYHMAKSVVDFKFPWRDIAPFIAAGLCSALCYLALGSYNIVIESFWRDAPILIAHILVAGAAYFTVSYALSSWFRSFLKAAKKFVLVEVLHIEG